MSTTQTAPTPPAGPDRTEPAEIYDECIFGAPGVCNSCHSRIKSDHRRVGDGVEGRDKVVKSQRVRAIRTHPLPPDVAGPEGPIVDYDVVDNPEIAAHPTRTVCGSCGSIAGRAPDDTLSKREAIARCDALADRLLEAGEPIDAEARSDLKRSVSLLKSNEDLEAYDHEIFERSTKVAVARVRKRH